MSSRSLGARKVLYKEIMDLIGGIMVTKELKDIKLQYARWEDIPAGNKSLFNDWMGADAKIGKSFFELYFYWYNIAHELGHVLRAYHDKSAESPWIEETAVNEFAVAYWRSRGENIRLKKLENLVRTAFTNLSDPLPNGEDRAQYFDAHYMELAQDPSAYGHYQFSMVLMALEKNTSLQVALQTHISPEAKDFAMKNSLGQYGSVDAELPQRIVKDMRKFLALFGVVLPEMQVTCSYSPMIEFVRWD